MSTIAVILILLSLGIRTVNMWLDSRAEDELKQAYSDFLLKQLAKNRRAK